MLLFIDLWGGFLPGNLARQGRTSQLRLQQIGPQATAYWRAQARSFVIRAAQPE
jgi:hypothetical protein